MRKLKNVRTQKLRLERAFAKLSFKNLCLTASILAGFTAVSQSSNLGNWLIYLGNKKLNNKWNLHHEVQYRNYNAVGDLEQLLLRGGLGYNVFENANVLLGYGYILSDNYVLDGSKRQVKEHRVYQQFLSKQAFGRVGLTHRYRFEQRFVESDFKLRFRYFLAGKVALNSPSLTYKNDSKKRIWYASAYNEIFIDTDNNPFDRNRIYGGLGVYFSKNLRVEAGYMNQVFSNGNRDQANLLVGFSF